MQNEGLVLAAANHSILVGFNPFSPQHSKLKQEVFAKKTPAVFYGLRVNVSHLTKLLSRQEDD